MISSLYGPWECAVIIIVAFILDLIAGDPEWLPHPVRIIGALVDFLDRFIRPFCPTPGAERRGGIFAALIVVVVSFGVTFVGLFILKGISVGLFYLVSVYLAWTTISARGLSLEAGRVMGFLKVSDLTGARRSLARIVGRETGGLTEADVTKAVVETVSENTSDGVIAPLFFLAVGGVPLAIAYKAVNTLDSMLGYKSERYINFGRFSARLDDAVNYLPARITAGLMVVSSMLLGFNWRASARILMRDGGAHPSPNAGLPEAAVAGAVGVRLGGPSSYGGVVHVKPHIGDALVDPTGASVAGSIRIMYLTGTIMAGIPAVIALIL